MLGEYLISYRWIKFEMVTNHEDCRVWSVYVIGFTVTFASMTSPQFSVCSEMMFPEPILHRVFREKQVSHQADADRSKRGRRSTRLAGWMC
jgi:hypothetical protein